MLSLKKERMKVGCIQEAKSTTYSTRLASIIWCLLTLPLAAPLSMSRPRLRTPIHLTPHILRLNFLLLLHFIFCFFACFLVRFAVTAGCEHVVRGDLWLAPVPHYDRCVLTSWRLMPSLLDLFLLVVQPCKHFLNRVTSFMTGVYIYTLWVEYCVTSQQYRKRQLSY